MTSSPPETTPPDHQLLHAWQALGVLKSHLESRELRGQSQVWLSEDARSVLRRFLKSKIVTAATPAAERATAMKQAAVEAKPMTEAISMKEEILRLTADEAVTKSAGPAILDISAYPVLSLADRETRLAALRAKAEVSPAARALKTLRDRMVFAVGNPMADLVFVGEAPGAQEEEEQEPFVGPAGQLLTKMIGAMGISRESTYISNICKFRPSVPGQSTNNRKPSAQEMASCLPYVVEEMEIVQPKVIVALGATAAEGLLGITAGVVGKLRLQQHSWRGIPVLVTYHPSYLLRNEAAGENTRSAIAEKRKVWEDLLKAMEILGLTISEKQRGYFLPKG